MRLTSRSRKAIHDIVYEMFGPGATVRLFGSRVDDTARGGDLDLLVEVDQILENRAASASRMAALLQQALGDQQIDIVLVDGNTTPQPIHEIARRSGVVL